MFKLAKKFVKIAAHNVIGLLLFVLKKTISFDDFERFERFGFHVIPLHYYSPILPIRRARDSRFHLDKERKMLGVVCEVSEQVDLLRELLPYTGECDHLPTYEMVSASGFGLGYGPVESHILYTMVRHLKPQRLIEVGSGISTFYAIQAANKNFEETNTSMCLHCIEPYPKKQLKSMMNSEITKVKLHKQPVEKIDPDFFSLLEEGDVLFIDSSHTVKLGGDVPFLYLDVLPRLNKGVWIHIHDIPLPYASIPTGHPLFNLFALWREVDLLQAFLINNADFRIRQCQSFLHYKAPDDLRAVFQLYNPEEHFPSSTWIEKIG